MVSRFARTICASRVFFTYRFLQPSIRLASYAGRSYYGPPEYRCSHCKASFWYEERVQSASSFKKRRIVYNLCCKGGKVHVPPFTKPPDYLKDLMKFDGNRRAKQFIQKIRQYNCLFAFTSMGATIDRSVNNSRGPPVFKISGSVCHRMGSLLPKGAESPLRAINSGDSIPNPKFCELYVYDTNNEVQNTIRALNPDDKTSGQLDETIVNGLIHMLNIHNPLVQQFRAGRDRLQEHGDEEIAIRLIGPVDGDSPQFSLPTANELAALIVGDFTVETSSRDIIVHDKESGLKQINSLHPAYMSLQYPLLFTYAERGFQLDIPYVGVPRARSVRDKMTMQDYYCYVTHYRLDQLNPYVCYGLLSSQSVVDARACIDEGRLWFILKNQDTFRADNMQGITDAVGNGCIDGSSLGKKTVLPSSHTGGRRYFLENFQDGLAICRVHGAPDIFTTFTCNPKWPEITEALLSEPGQRPTGRADIVVRVYHMKLAEYIADIRSGMAFGPVKAGTVCSISFHDKFFY